MSRLCERPGCSQQGAAEYGMVPEDLLFWIAPISSVPYEGQAVLCQRHADAMSVPRGWTLDDRREEFPQLFSAKRFADDEQPSRERTTRRRTTGTVAEQLVIDGTGEIPRPAANEVASPEAGVDESGEADAAQPWVPEFDEDSDLGGLLEVSSPLLSRAFRGTDRPRR